jgi:hypothetical protein
MKFYFISENGAATLLTGSVKEIVKRSKELSKAQETWIGFLGVITDNTHVVKSSITYRYTDKNLYTKIAMFVRKYHGLSVLQGIADSLKANS